LHFDVEVWSFIDDYASFTRLRNVKGLNFVFCHDEICVRVGSIEDL
jgi:hypothetical protein